MKPGRLRRAGKARRVALFVLLLVMLVGLHLFGNVISRPLPWWFSLGWLVVTGWVCREGWERDVDEPRPAPSPGQHRLSTLAVLIGGLGMCWLGWIGWQSRDDSIVAVFMAMLGPIGALWLLWLVGKLLAQRRS